MQTIARSSFTTVKTEGGLLPADVLQRIAWLVCHQSRFERLETGDQRRET